jgi:hypothetical protein
MRRLIFLTVLNPYVIGAIVGYVIACALNYVSRWINP